VLLPGLVNAHSHLDLSGAAPIPAREDFTAWLLGVGAVRGDGRDVEGTAREEAEALGRAGVTAVGDIEASGGAATRGRRAAGLAGVSYVEIVGVGRESVRARLAAALQLVDRLDARHTGLSPHAPYSVHGEVVPEIVRAAAQRGLRLAMHLAETPEETRYLLRGDGPFERFLASFGPGRPFATPPRLRPVAWADAAGLLAAGCLVVHGNDLDDDDVARLAARGASVVYCHGTHAHFGRPPHRIGELLAAGVNVALGTDSGLSNRGVDLWAELLRLAADRPDLDPLALLECATAGGRRALGLEPEAAHWQPGTRADALLLAAPPPSVETWTARDVASWALSGAAQPAATVHGGRIVAGRSSPASLAAFLDAHRAQG
jgi:cytosine/adenosine deaminase-related metal-dependent hydrolase